MLPVIQGKGQRNAVKGQLIDFLKGHARGHTNAVPADALAVKLGWPDCLGSVVERLVCEIMVDAQMPELIGTCEDGIYLVVNSEDRRIARLIAHKRMKEYERIYKRLRY